MRAEILAVGTELLLGQIPNTNAQTISTALAEAGIGVLFHSVVGDNEERIASSIRTAIDRADLIILTGGLGPTHDDLTREAISRVTGRPLERRPELERMLRDRFERIGRRMSPTNLRQAEQPQRAEVIPNRRGSAPGVHVEQDGKLLFALPGVPHEMKSMLEEFVLPRIGSLERSSAVVSRTVNVFGIPESEIA